MWTSALPRRRSCLTGVMRSLEELAVAAQDGNVDAVRALIVAVAPVILGAVRRIVGARHPDVEDIAQDASIHLVRALSAYRGECSMRQFASRVATNRALAARRHAGYRETWTPASDPHVLDQSASEEHGRDAYEQVVAAQRRAAVRRLLDDLPEAQAETMALYFVVGLTAEEIALATGVGVPAVRGRLRLARQVLRDRVATSSVLRDLLEGDG